jgi:hypothetical protein
MDTNTTLLKPENPALVIASNSQHEEEKLQEQGQEQAVYMAEDIQRALCLGKTKTYEFLRQVYITQQPFRVIKIGKIFRIPKYSFDRWLYSDSGEVS